MHEEVGREALCEDKLEARVPVPKRARRLGDRLFDLAATNDAEGALSTASLQALQDSGFAHAVFSEERGGDGLSRSGKGVDLATVLQAIGGGDLSVARLYEGHVNAVHLVERYGTAEQAASLATAVRSGALSAVWNAEGGEPLTAEPAGRDWLLKGQKILASGAGIITRPLVTPRTPAGPVLMLLDLAPGERADLSRWTPLGMRASATGTIDLSGLRVPRCSVIGEPGDYMRQPTFSGGAWRFCAVHLGAAERLVDLFRTHLLARGRHDDPYQKQRVAAAVAAATTAGLWIERAAKEMAKENLQPEAMVAFVNLTRSVTERACLDVLELVQRGIGLTAFVRPNPVERISRDLATYLRQPVPDQAAADAGGIVLGSAVRTAELWSSCH